MRIFQTKPFRKFAKELNLSVSELREASKEIAEGLVDAELGGNLYKKRIAYGAKGKRGGARTILVYRKSPQYIFFLYGFAKNEKDNLTSRELKAYRLLEKQYSALSVQQIQKLLELKELLEISDAGSDKTTKSKDGQNERQGKRQKG